MLRVIAYGSLTIIGAAAALVSPLAGAVACLEAYLLNPSIIVGDDTIRFQLVATIAFAGGLLIHQPRGVRAGGRGRGLLAGLWVFVAIAFSSATWAVVGSAQAVDAATELLKTVLVISLIVRTVEREDQMQTLVTACIVGVAHAAIAHTFGVRFGYVPARYGREYGVLPDGQTHVMVLFLPLLLVTAASAASAAQRWLAIAAIPLVLNSIVSSYMRTGFVSIAVEGALLVLFLPKRLVLRVAPILLAAIALFVFRLTPADYWDRVETIRTPTEEASAASRFELARVSLQMLADYPFGVGYRNYPDVSPRYLPPEYLTQGRRSAHNSYLSVLCETGIAGFAFWISAFGGALLLLRRIRRASAGRQSLVATYALGLEVGLYGWLAGGLFQADHEVDPAYWFVAFAVVLARLHAMQPVAVPEVRVDGGVGVTAPRWSLRPV